jgi:hypothetical protein
VRLDILDRGHRLHAKAIMAVIRVFSGHPVVDAVKLALYRPNFYGRALETTPERRASAPQNSRREPK